MKYLKKIDCLVCDGEKAFLYADERYNGLRGWCERCETNWPES